MSEMSIEKLRIGDLKRLAEENPENPFSRTVNAELERIQAENPYSYTGSVNGKILFCVGVLKYWEDRGEAWAFIDKHAGPYMRKITRAVGRMVEICELKRLELSVEDGFEKGHRWAKILGFELESPRLRAYFPGGKDAALYVRIKNG